MKHTPCSHLCANFQAAMEVLSRPWNGLIMATLDGEAALRFSVLRERLQTLGDRMLAARLRELEARGLLTRRVIAGPPVRVEYALTETGRGFREVALALGTWGAGFSAKPARSSETQRKRRRAKA